MTRIDVTQQSGEWRSWLDAMGLDDPYYDATYGRLWERDERAEWYGLRFDAGDDGSVVYPVLRDPLTYLPEASGYCDIRTAYDFGGPVARGPAPSRAMRKFRSELESLADEWGIVTEFARLHPYQVDPLPTGAEHHADNLHVDLSLGIEQIRERYHEKQARRVGQANRRGVKVCLREGEDASKRADDFLELYYRTMLRVGAGRHYYFLPETLRGLVAFPEMTLAIARLDAKSIGAGLFFGAGETLFYFLSGSHPSFLEARPNNLMLDRMVEFGCAKGFRRMHLGGGSESLRRFKGQVATGSVDYHVMKKVYDRETYIRLCESVGIDPDESGAFPAYWPLKYEDRERPPLF